MVNNPDERKCSLTTDSVAKTRGFGVVGALAQLPGSWPASRRFASGEPAQPLPWLRVAHPC